MFGPHQKWFKRCVGYKNEIQNLASKTGGEWCGICVHISTLGFSQSWSQLKDNRQHEAPTRWYWHAQTMRKTFREFQQRVEDAGRPKSAYAKAAKALGVTGQKACVR